MSPARVFKHGGFRPGAGRKPRQQGETVNYTLRLYTTERDVLRELGGVAFIRQMIEQNRKG